MAKSINDITSVKMTERHYDIDKMQPGVTSVIELTEDRISTYYTEYKKRKKLNLEEKKVDKKEMSAFFIELYEFARSAEMCCETIDDCSHEIVFNYGPFHREIFQGETVKGKETLNGKIYAFLNLHK